MKNEYAKESFVNEEKKVLIPTEPNIIENIKVFLFLDDVVFYSSSKKKSFNKVLIKILHLFFQNELQLKLAIFSLFLPKFIKK